MMNHPDRVNHPVAVQSPIALHAGMVLIILAILHSNHLNGDGMNGADVRFM